MQTLEQAARALLEAMDAEPYAKAWEFDPERDALRAALAAESGRVMTQVGWQCRLVSPEDGPGPWRFVDAAFVECFSARPCFETRPVYALAAAQEGS